jgi:excisionase family DNA binding protein
MAPLGSDRPKPHDRRQPRQSDRLVYSVPEAGRLLGLSRNGAYEAAKRGDIPVIRIGRLLVVPKARFHRTFELMPPADGEPNDRS